MAAVQFEVEHRFRAPVDELWWEMTDWPRHADWIPATRVELGEGDSRAVGATFTAWTGYGPFTLEDRMRVTALDWDESGVGRCEVEKLGPVLRGRAGFQVTADGADYSTLRWFEDVTIPFVPQLLAPIINRLSAFGFSQGMRSLARTLESRQAPLGS